MSELESLVRDVTYTVLPNSTVTVCNMVLKSGFENIAYSTVMNPQDFDKSIGEEVARANAIDKLWEFEGYHRKMSLYEDSLVAQANTELWDNREYGCDENTTQLASVADDRELADIIFQDAHMWEPSLDKDGNYVPPVYGADEKYVKKSKMSDTLMSLLGKNVK